MVFDFDRRGWFASRSRHRRVDNEPSASEVILVRSELRDEADPEAGEKMNVVATSSEGTLLQKGARDAKAPLAGSGSFVDSPLAAITMLFGEEEATPPQRAMTPEEKSREAAVTGSEREDPTFTERQFYVDDLENQLATSYYWSGDLRKDFIFFVRNWHPILGMFLCHPYHPWDQRERVLTFIVSCCMTMLPSAFLVSRAKPDESPNDTAMIIFIAVTLPMAVVEVALYWLSIGDIYCKGCMCCARFVNFVKSSCLWGSFICSALLLIATFESFGHIQAARLVHPFLISRLQSAITWFPIWFLQPCVGFLHVWYTEKKALKAAAAEALNS